jgi:hypothetical protein
MADKTVTIRPSGGDYTSLDAANTGELLANAVLTAGGLDGRLRFKPEGDWSAGPDTTISEIHGFTVDAEHYPYVEPDAANKAGTSYSASKYRLELSSATQPLTITNAYTRCIGLQIYNTNASGAASISVAGGNSILDSILARGGARGIRIESGASGTNIIVNTISYGASTAAIRTYAGTNYIYNCVAIGGTYGMFCDSLDYVRNGYAYGSTGAYYKAPTTTSASNDATGTLGLRSIAYNTTQFANVTAGSEDFSLPSGSGLIGVGTDLRADATWPFDYDIMGTTRGATWDVGAFEYVAPAGGLSIPVAMHHYRMLRG